MKIHILIVTILMAVTGLYGCGSAHQNETKQHTTKVVKADSVSTLKMNPNTVYVVYVHTNIRCESCVAVENQTRKMIHQLFPKEMQSGKVVYYVFNMEKPGNEDFVKKYKVAGQTMLFIKGDKYFDKTVEAFMNIPYEPLKWQGIVQKTVQDLLNEK